MVPILEVEVLIPYEGVVGLLHKVACVELPQNLVVQDVQQVCHSEIEKLSCPPSSALHHQLRLGSRYEHCLCACVQHSVSCGLMVNRVLDMYHNNHHGGHTASNVAI